GTRANGDQGIVLRESVPLSRTFSAKAYVWDFPSPALVGPVGPYSLRTGLLCLDISGRCDSLPVHEIIPRNLSHAVIVPLEASNSPDSTSALHRLIPHLEPSLGDWL